MEATIRPLLEIQRLKVSFYQRRETVQVVRGVDFVLFPGEIVGILGESGSGKTVTASSILGIYSDEEVKMNEGSVLYDGKMISGLSQKELEDIRGKEIAYIFQNPSAALNPYKRIGKQLQSVMQRHGVKGGYNKVIHTLHEVGIDEAERVYAMYPFQLSGGLNQRIMIAQALLLQPKILIADEPTSSIDASLSKKVLDLLLDLNERYHMSVVLITHDFDVAKYMCDRILIMYGGLILEEGKMEEVFNQPLHPYTKQLLRCVMSLDKDDKKVHVLEGNPITPKEFRNACPFYERCQKKADLCTSDIPPMTAIGERKVRCYFAERED